MASVREEVDIAAPVDRVWAVVHEDFPNATKWTNNLERVDILTEGPLRKGTRLRYVLSTPAGKQELEVEHTTVTPDRTCAGKFIKGPIKGGWKYSYAVAGDGTRLTYSMEYEPNGFAARLFFGAIERQLPSDLAKTLARLKKYIEGGGGQARPAAPKRTGGEGKAAAKAAGKPATTTGSTKRAPAPGGTSGKAKR